MAHEISPQSGKTGRPGDSAIVNGKPLTDKENQEYQQQQVQEQEQVGLRAEALALKLAQTYEELTRLLERNPGVKRQITEGEAKEEKVYQKLKQRLSPQPAQNRRGPGTPGLKLADMAPRCRWVRQDGTSCRSPQLKHDIYCFAHRQMAEARTLLLMLPAPEDANAIQVGLMRIQKALIEDTISTKKAGLLLYSMQLALTNVGQTTFGQAKDEEMVRETVDEEEAFREKQHPPRRHGGTEEEKGLRRMDADERGLQSAVSQSQNLFTTEDTEKNQGLPLMNTDDTDFREADREDGGGDVEFVPVPGGYGFERVRLRIEPELQPNQNLFTTEGTEDTEDEKGLPRMDADERGLQGEESSREIEFVPGSVLQTEPYANLG
jgi:hypothetical protein